MVTKAGGVKRGGGFAAKRAQLYEALTVLRARRLTGKFGVASIPLSIPGIDQLCNPSIVRDGKGWTVAARQTNYRLDRRGRYTIKGGFGRIKSETWLLSLDDGLASTGARRLDDSAACAEVPEARQGVEDPRLFWQGSDLMCLWSGLRLGDQVVPSRDSDVARDITVRPDWAGATTTMMLAPVNHIGPFHASAILSPTGSSHEKNWMPFVHEGEVHFLYYLKAMEVYRLAADGLKAVYCAPTEIAPLKGWSGSSQLVEWEGNWLCVAHFANRSLKNRHVQFGPYYTHRLVLLSSDWQVVGLSDPFFFEKKGIEFCGGLAVSGDRVVFAYGIDDRRGAILELTRQQVNDLIKP